MVHFEPKLGDWPQNGTFGYTSHWKPLYQILTSVTTFFS